MYTTFGLALHPIVYCTLSSKAERRLVCGLVG